MAKYEEYQRELTYRIYITDSLFYGNQDKYIKTRFIDILEPPKVDTRSGDEIAADVIKRLNLKVGE